MRSRLAALAVLLGVLGALAGACSEDGGSRDEFCAALPETPDLSVVLDDLDSARPEQLEDRFSKAADQFRELERASPDAIRDDVDRVAGVVEEILDVVEQHLDDRDALRAELASRNARLLAVGAPAQRVVDYARDACGVELGG